ncbi:MAG TPA: hypothetical protein VFZ26_06060 [Gemmatimonadales bacterium]
MTPQIVAPGYPSARLLSSIERILGENTLCSMATRSEAGVISINAAFFAFSPALELCFLSNPASAHCRNLSHVSQMAVTVFDSHQEWGRPHAGLQLYGQGGVLPPGHAERVQTAYAARFPRYFDFVIRAGDAPEGASGLGNLRFYRFVPARVKILDEGEFGDEVYITADVVSRPAPPRCRW